MRIVLLAWLVAGAAFGQANRALVMGNTAYRNLPPAVAGREDAGAVAQALSDPALHFSAALKLDLSLEAMTAAVNEFAASVKPGETVVVFYSGYTAMIDGENYLLATNHSAAEPQGYSLTGLLQALAEKKPGAVVALIDGSRECAPLAEIAGLTRLPRVERSLAVFSHQYERVIAQKQSQQSAFAAAVVKALSVPGLTLSGLGERITIETQKLTNGEQTPVFALNSLEEIRVLRAAPAAVKEVALVKAGELRELKKDLLSYAWIPPGKMQIGCVESDKDCDENERAARREVTMKAGFWMTRTEVTVRGYERFLRETGHPRPRKSQTNAEGQQAANPAGGVSGEDARTYCAWIGGRLPTDEEWEYAARGGKPGMLYSWGNELTHEMANYYGRDKKMRDRWDESNSAPVGSFDPNGFNLFDMTGNVREWVDGGKPGLRGGDFAGALKALRISHREERAVTERDNRSGFRCVMDTWSQPD